MDTTQVPAGYKVTELGVLPQDWEVAKLGKHVAFRTGPFGSALHKSDYVPGGIPIVNPMQIVAGELVPTESMAISKQAAIQLSDFLLSPGDIVIGRRGEMGRCAVVEDKNDGWLCGTGSMIIKVSKSVNARYLQRILSSPAVIAAIESTSVGTTMINLNQSVLGNLIIPLPSPAEQQAIAEALGEMDALLAAQRARLAKQRAVKQGLLQGLLSGEQRLPGFVGEWEVRRLGDCLDRIIGGGTPSRSNPKYWGGKIPWATVKDVMTFHPASTQEYITSEGFADSSSNMVPKGTLILATRMAVGHGVIFTVDVAINQDLKALFPSKRLDNKYLFYYLEREQENIEQIGFGSTVKGLQLTDLKAIKLMLPLIDEQRAIADVLTEADAHLAALEAEYAKTQLLKQGMMQNLLTGKIRLV